MMSTSTSDIPRSLIRPCAERLLATISGREHLCRLMRGWPQQSQRQPRLQVAISEINLELVAIRPRFGFMQQGVVNFAAGSYHICPPGSRNCRQCCPDISHKDGAARRSGMESTISRVPQSVYGQAQDQLSQPESYPMQPQGCD